MQAPGGKMIEPASEATSAEDRANAAPEYLCSDLDGTVLATNSMCESALALLSRRPWFALLFPFWLARGKATFKAEVARRATLDAETLPIRNDVVDFLKTEAGKGRKLILATGANRAIANSVAERLGFFSAILASDANTNLTGKRKIEAIHQYVGDKEFDYVGDSSADLPVWSSASSAILVRPTSRLLRKVEGRRPVTGVLGRGGGTWSEFLTALRPRQWVKNLLVFLPLVMGHQVRNIPLLVSSLIAFAAFCLCASGSYILNDLLDLEADRRHTTKRNRPLASGRLPLWVGICLAPLLTVAGLVAASSLRNEVVVFELAGYVAATIIYSLYAKRVPVADVLVLTGLYLLRIFAGGAATGVPLSPWLIGFSMFFLLSLAFAKRHGEIRTQLAGEGAGNSPSKRNYAPQDLDMVRQFGVTSGYISVLVLALYVNGREVMAMYRHPDLIWLTCPLVLFWISRVWFLANRGKLHEDPIVFATEDKISYLTGLALLLTLYLAT